MGNLSEHDTRRGDLVSLDIRTPEELLSAVAQGDERAFELLYDRLAAPVTAVVCAVLRDQRQSEEVAQEVFVELWRTARRYRQDRSRAITWALAIAHQRAIDRVRYQEQADEDTAHPDHRLGLWALPTRERDPVLLAYQGLTYRDVADILGVATGTASHGIRAGLRRLRDQFTANPATAPRLPGQAGKDADDYDRPEASSHVRGRR